jgi:uncharacterized protein
MNITNTALHVAVENNDLPALVKSLKVCRDINVPGKFGRTALHLAAKGGNTEIVRYLLDHGADINIKNTHGFTALYVASIANNVDVMQLLLGAGTVEVDAEDLGGMTPLISACCNGCAASVIKCLLDHGANPGARDSIGRTAADWAREKGFAELTAVLSLCIM